MLVNNLSGLILQLFHLCSGMLGLLARKSINPIILLNQNVTKEFNRENSDIKLKLSFMLYTLSIHLLELFSLSYTYLLK